jgi:predicted heme/steroid binding protein
MINRKMMVVSIVGLVVISFGLAGCQSQKQADKAAIENSTVQSSGTNTTAASSETATIPPAPEGLTLTLEELKAFNGENGQPAYVAVDGIVYDVSAIGKWKNGVHQGKYHAGNDLSEEIKKSPHGKGFLDQAVIVGELAK